MKFKGVSVSLFAILAFVFLFTLLGHSQWEAKQAPYGRHINSVNVLDVNTIVVAGGNPSNDAITSIFKSTDRGNNWSIIMDVVPSPWLKGMSFPSGGIGYVAGWNGKIMKTTDGGLNWVDKPASGSAANRHFNDIFFIDNQTGFAVGGNKSNDSIQTIIKTTDGGNNWSIQRDNLGFWLNAVHFVNANTGYAVGDKGVVLKTTNGGSNWNTLTLNGNFANRNYFDVYFSDANNGWIVGGNKSNDSIRTILKTTDGGTSWNVISDGLQNQVNGIAFSSANTAWVVGDKGHVLKSTDGGANFSSLNLSNSLTDGVDLYCAHFLNNDFGVVAGQYGKILVYSNNIPDAPVAQTGDVDILSPSAVRLKGTAIANGSASVSFEYGPTMGLGNTVSATPSSVSGNTPQNIEATLTSLAPGIYYYRAKAENIGGVSYGTSKQFYVGPNPIPNFDFEHWTTNTRLGLDEWFGKEGVTKVPSYDGTSAVRLATDLSSGDSTTAIVIGDFDNGFSGGAPFAARPDSMVVHVKYELQPGYDAVILLLFKKAGNIMAQNIFTYSGNSGGVFERLSFPISYMTSDVPDTVLLGLANNNPFAGTQHILNVVTLDNISFVGTTENVPNSAFENWSEIVTETLDFWKVSENNGHYIAQKTTDAYHGDFALRFQNEHASQHSGGASVINDDYQQPTFAVGGRHTSLNGYYKFQGSATDTFNISLQMFKDGQLIGHAGRVFSATNSYTPFSIDINYFNSEIPDSANLHVRLGAMTGASPNAVAFIDNLSFDGFNNPENVGIVENPVAEVEVLLYPNPAQSYFALGVKGGASVQSVKLMSLNGQVWQVNGIYSGYENVWMFDLGNLPSGIYVVVAQLDNQTIHTHKLVVSK